MKVALAAPTAYFPSAAPSVARDSRVSDAATRLSGRALLDVEDRAGHTLEVCLRLILGSSLLVALGQCFQQLF